MKRLFIAALFAALCCAGCAPIVRTNVTIFHTLPATQSGKTIIISSTDAALDGTLEFRNFAEKLASHFATVGYRAVPRGPNTAPDYVVVFRYGIDDGREVVESSSSPVYDEDDSDEITGYTTTTNRYTLYRRVITLDMYDFATYRANQNLDQSQVYTARLISNGPCASLAGVIDPMLNALFDEFPGDSGRARTVRRNGDRNSC